jgi:hypothetical protein
MAISQTMKDRNTDKSTGITTAATSTETLSQSNGFPDIQAKGVVFGFTNKSDKAMALYLYIKATKFSTLEKNKSNVTLILDSNEALKLIYGGMNVDFHSGELIEFFSFIDKSYADVLHEHTVKEVLVDINEKVSYPIREKQQPLITNVVKLMSDEMAQ